MPCWVLGTASLFSFLQDAALKLLTNAEIRTACEEWFGMPRTPIMGSMGPPGRRPHKALGREGLREVFPLLVGWWGGLCHSVLPYRVTGGLPWWLSSWLKGILAALGCLQQRSSPGLICRNPRTLISALPLLGEVLLSSAHPVRYRMSFPAVATRILDVPPPIQEEPPAPRSYFPETWLWDLVPVG